MANSDKITIRSERLSPLIRPEAEFEAKVSGSHQQIYASLYQNIGSKGAQSIEGLLTDLKAALEGCRAHVPNFNSDIIRQGFWDIHQGKPEGPLESLRAMLLRTYLASPELECLPLCAAANAIGRLQSLLRISKAGSITAHSVARQVQVLVKNTFTEVFRGLPYSISPEVRGEKQLSYDGVSLNIEALKANKLDAELIEPLQLRRIPNFSFKYDAAHFLQLFKNEEGEYFFGLASRTARTPPEPTKFFVTSDKKFAHLNFRKREDGNLEIVNPTGDISIDSRGLYTLRVGGHAIEIEPGHSLRRTLYHTFNGGIQFKACDTVEGKVYMSERMLVDNQGRVWRCDHVKGYGDEYTDEYGRRGYFEDSDAGLVFKSENKVFKSDNSMLSGYGSLRYRDRIYHLLRVDNTDHYIAHTKYHSFVVKADGHEDGKPVGLVADPDFAHDGVGTVSRRRHDPNWYLIDQELYSIWPGPRTRAEIAPFVIYSLKTGEMIGGAKLFGAREELRRALLSKVDLKKLAGAISQRDREALVAMLGADYRRLLHELTGVDIDADPKFQWVQKNGSIWGYEKVDLFGLRSDCQVNNLDILVMDEKTPRSATKLEILQMFPELKPREEPERWSSFERPLHVDILVGSDDSHRIFRVFHRGGHHDIKISKRFWQSDSYLSAEVLKEELCNMPLALATAFGNIEAVSSVRLGGSPLATMSSESDRMRFHPSRYWNDVEQVRRSFVHEAVHALHMKDPAASKRLFAASILDGLDAARPYGEDNSLELLSTLFEQFLVDPNFHQFRPHTHAFLVHFLTSGLYGPRGVSKPNFS